MADLGTLETILSEVGKGLLPLKAAISSPNSFFAFMLKLGWRADDVPQPIQDLGTGLDTLLSELQELLGSGVSVDGSVSLESTSVSTNLNIEDIARLTDAVRSVVDGIHAIATAPDAAIPATLRDDNFKNIFPKQLIDYLLITYLTKYQPSLAFALRAFGVIKKEFAPAAGNRPDHVKYTFDFGEIPTTLANPGLVLRNAFGWGTTDFDYRLLASEVDNLFISLGMDVFIEEISADVGSKIDGGVSIEGDPIRTAVQGVFFERPRSSGRMVADVRLMYLPEDGPKKPGFALMPGFNGLLDFKMQLGPDISVIIKSDLDVQGGVALLVRPGRPIEMLLGFNNPGAPTHATGSASVAVERSASGTPMLLLGSPNETRLQLKALSGLGGIRLDSDNTVDVFAEFELKGLEFVLKPSNPDGFIAKIFPSEAQFGFDLTTGYSYLRGFYLRGAANLEIQVPLHLQLGPINLESLTISANPADGKIPITLGVDFKATLGPLIAVVQNIGVTSTFSFPERGGNLGPVDFALAFKPPNGLGLALDAGVIRGGGFLFVDSERGEYAGALELTFSEIVSLKAIGLISTKMPDGRPGFSLLIIITAEFGAGFQLGYGFTLLGVGGLLGLNRTMKLQPLMDGIRTGAIESIMFPHDVIANAPKIISDLRIIFPPFEGKFLIGPMAKLGWGTPTLISISLGIIIEIPGNIALLGILKIAIPAEEIPLIVLQVNFAGAIEFDRKRIYFFAALFESRVVFITLEGEMGLLMAFGDDPNFVATVGGFHPRFSPPPLPFPSPRRIAVNILNTPVARIRIEGYFAITSNTVQFGARIEAFFGLDEINVKGHLAFDALFQFSPFFFIIEISASFSVNVFGLGLFSVRVRGTLDGPAPYHIKGSGSISFFFFDVDVDFEETWGERRNTELPPIPVMPILQAEIDKADNWRALLPAANNLLVSLRQMPPEEAALILHPLGTLQLSQRALPLELKLDKVGTQKPNDVNRLSIAVTGGGLAKKDDSFEQFAPAQFQNFSDSDKLSRPAFAPEKSGLKLSAAGADTRSGVMVKRIVRYEEIIIDNNFKRFQRRFAGYFGSLFTHFLAGNAVSRSAVSHATKSALQPFSETIRVQTETYTVAFQSSNTAFAADSFSFHSEASARDYMNRKIAEDASLTDEMHVIPSFEMAA